MTYQTDEKHLNNMSEYFVGVVNIAFNLYNNRFLLSIILTKSSNQISTSVSVKNVKNSSGVTKGEFLTHIGVHHTGWAHECTRTVTPVQVGVDFW